MKRILLATAALGAAILVAVPVVAQQSGQGGGPGFHRAHMGGMMGGGMERMCENREARMAGMLAFAETKLNITQQQRAAWTQFTETVRSADAPMARLCDQIGDAEQPATLPDRVERMEQVMAARLEQIQTVRPALEQLYQSLTPEQRQIADEFMNRRGHARR